MSKIKVCVLFGGISPEHEVSLRSAESVLNNMDSEKYDVFPVGITKNGQWLYYGSNDYSKLPDGSWVECQNNCKAIISPERNVGLMLFREDSLSYQKIDVVFPVLHGENGEDGTMQGLLQMAGIPFVGPHSAQSAVSMDKTLTKLVADKANVTQAAWQLVLSKDLSVRTEEIIGEIELRFSYPVFVKPAGTGSSVGVSKVSNREELIRALFYAGQYDAKILVEEFIHGREIEVAVLGNTNPVASICGEIDSGAEFYDYDAKYVTDTSVAYIPARIDDDVAERVRELAIRVYSAVGCVGLSRVDFFVTHGSNKVVFNEINTMPGFTSISMYPKLFAASGIAYSDLIDQLILLALEAGV